MKTKGKYFVKTLEPLEYKKLNIRIGKGVTIPLNNCSKKMRKALLLNLKKNPKALKISNEAKPDSMMPVYRYRGNELVAIRWEESNSSKDKTHALLNELFLYIQSGKAIRKNSIDNRR